MSTCLVLISAITAALSALTLMYVWILPLLSTLKSAVEYEGVWCSLVLWQVIPLAYISFIKDRIVVLTSL